MFTYTFEQHFQDEITHRLRDFIRPYIEDEKPKARSDLRRGAHARREPAVPAPYGAAHRDLGGDVELELILRCGPVITGD